MQGHTPHYDMLLTVSFVCMWEVLHVILIIRAHPGHASLICLIWFVLNPFSRYYLYSKPLSVTYNEDVAACALWVFSQEVFATGDDSNTAHSLARWRKWFWRYVCYFRQPRFFFCFFFTSKTHRKWKIALLCAEVRRLWQDWSYVWIQDDYNRQ